MSVTPAVKPFIVSVPPLPVICADASCGNEPSVINRIVLLVKLLAKGNLKIALPVVPVQDIFTIFSS